jgi:hypothetical protein
MMSKGSERPASMFAPNERNDRPSTQGVGLGGGNQAACGTSNSVVMSGTPTDVSNYYNQQTYFQINYIAGKSANRQGS